MITIAIILVTSLVYLVGFRYSFRLIYQNMFSGELEWFELIASIYFAALLTVVLPIFLSCRWIGRAFNPKSIANTIAGQSRADKNAERDKRLKMLERRNSELERELGIS